MEEFAGVTSIGNGLPLGSLAGAVSDELIFDDAQTTTSYAVFGQLNYALTDKLKVSGGLRYTKDKKEFTQSLSALGNAQCDNDHFEKTWDAVTWRAGLDYQVTDQTFAYVSASKGFKAGGFNLGACDNPFDPETVIAYEGGIKNRFFDNKVTLNLTGFYYDYRDLQTNIYTIGGGTVQNAANAKIWGSEIELMAEPIAGLQLIGNLSLLHTEFDEFFAADPYNPTAGVQDLTGNRLQRAPKWTANGVVSYTLAVGNGDANIRYEVYHSDGYYNNVHNTPDTLQKPYTVQNFRISFSQDEWVVCAFAENFTDEIYTMMRLPIGGVGAVVGVYAPRATWGVYSRLHF